MPATSFGRPEAGKQAGKIKQRRKTGAKGKAKIND
jgi:hypothetical protein